MTQNQQISLDTPALKIELLLNQSISGFEHIILRPLELLDAPEIIMAVEESLSDLRKFMPWSHFPQTVDGQKQRIIQNHHKYWAEKDFGFGIFAPDGKKFLGGCGLHPRSLNPQCLEIGYWVRSSIAGQGLCTEVTKALTAYCFSYLGLSRVQCGFDTKNTASQRVNEKCGFKLEGVLREFCPLPASLIGKSAGWDGSGDVAMTSLLKQDLPNLAWYKDTLSRLKVLNWHNQEAKPTLGIL